MTDITLNAATRTSVLELQRNARLRLQTASHLESGRRVSRVNDNPSSFFQGKALSNRVSDLLQLKSGTGQALSAVESALDGTEAVESLTRQLRGLAVSAKGVSSEQRAAISEQFDTLRNQLGALAADVSYGGVSLLSSPAQSLNVEVGDVSSAEISVNGQAADAASLGIGTASGDYNGFATDADIDAALSALGNAVTTVRSATSQFGSSVASLNIREEFTTSLSQTLSAGEAKLVNADLNEEGARLLAIRSRDALGQLGIQVATQSESSILQLLGGGA